MKRSALTLVSVLSAALALSACATLPTMSSVETFESQKNYPALITSVGVYTDDGTEAAKAQKRAMAFILGNKAEALPEVVSALEKGSGDLRAGGAEVAFEWSDPAFIEPLFTALGDGDETTRQKVGYAFKKQADAVPVDIREKTALRLMDHLQKEKGISVVIAIASALAVYAVPATHDPLVALKDEIFKSKKHKLNLLGGTAPRYYEILAEKNLEAAIITTSAK